MPNIFVGLDHLARQALPALGIAFLILAASVPSPIDGALMPDLVLVAIFVTAARNPEAVPVWLVFVLGLLRDLLGSTPVGVHSILFLLVHFVAVSQRRYLEYWPLLWVGFALTAFAVATASWGLLSAYHAAWLEALPMLLRALVSVLIFPLLAAPILWLLRINDNVDQRA